MKARRFFGEDNGGKAVACCGKVAPQVLGNYFRIISHDKKTSKITLSSVHWRAIKRSTHGEGPKVSGAIPRQRVSMVGTCPSIRKG